jgi:hypothetical protein
MLCGLYFNHSAMRFLPQEVESRREFFRAVARYSALTLASVAACLVARPRRLARQRCVNQGICCTCGIFAECGLPQALSAKRAEAKG